MSQTQAVGSNVPTISIVTATYNAAALLPRLVTSLKAQTDQDFEWVVADGGSSDDTVKIVEDAKVSLRQVLLTSQPDFGIYDALNRGVKVAQGNYYIVLGADDTLEANAIANYKRAIGEAGADLVTACVESNGNMQGARRADRAWLYGQFAYISAHAVGLAIKRSLHEKVGFYSRKYPIAADQLFVMLAVAQGADVSRHDFVAGRFEHALGTSGQDVLGSLVELFRIQVQLGRPLAVQVLLLLIRMWRFRRSIMEGRS
jgi:glycosyltransferase involved in cell wall biosynthesis